MLSITGFIDHTQCGPCLPGADEKCMRVSIDTAAINKSLNNDASTVPAMVAYYQKQFPYGDIGVEFTNRLDGP